jgi:plastocyanin
VTRPVGRAAAALAAALGLLAITAGPASPAGQVHRVAMKDVGFEPKEIRAHVGDTVEWANADAFAHTATARDKTWDVNVLPGKSGRATLKSPGTMAYFCRYHPNMTGAITVEP